MVLRAGRYEILRPIASGGMAQVHLGRAVATGGFERQVAIKTMHPHLTEEPEFVAMFLDEARLSARVHHPNVVATLDVQQDGEGIFLVMDYVEGFALHALLAASRDEASPLPFGLTLRIVLDTLAGLHAAHELTDGDGVPLEVIHRDVSPQNILVGVDGSSRITDFGIARAAVRLASTREGRLKGKLRYLAPEQLGGGPIDRRTDIHAAGAVLWEMLAGRCLVHGEDEGACFIEIGKPDKASPRAVNPDVPEPIAAACLRALRLDPGERYATAADFADALEGAAASAGILVASPREVSVFVRALQARGASISRRAENLGGRTETGAPLGPQTVTTEKAGVALPRAAPRARRTVLVVAVALLAAGAAIVATAARMRSPTSVQAAASSVTVTAMPVAPATAAAAANSVEKAPPAAPPPSASPPSTSSPTNASPSSASSLPSASPSSASSSRTRQSVPFKPRTRFRPREL